MTQGQTVRDPTRDPCLSNSSRSREGTPRVLKYHSHGYRFEYLGLLVILRFFFRTEKRPLIRHQDRELRNSGISYTSVFL